MTAELWIYALIEGAVGLSQNNTAWSPAQWHPWNRYINTVATPWRAAWLN